jgi:L-threonylcarbamoyladenylate synthase
VTPVEQAAEVVRAGGVVCFPTETYYGLAALAMDAAAVGKVIAAKGRPDAMPIACVAADLAIARRLWAEPVDKLALRLADDHWPGPLTIVAAAAPDLPAELAGPGGIGVRVSPHPLAAALAHAVGAPITATSANRSGAPACRTIDAARAQLGDAVDFYLDAGETPGGAPSTLVEVHGSIGKILRAGALTLSPEELTWPR